MEVKTKLSTNNSFKGLNQKNLTALITGAAGGIGRAVARAFASTGAKVMAVDLDQEKVDVINKF